MRPNGRWRIRSKISTAIVITRLKISCAHATAMPGSPGEVHHLSREPSEKRKEQQDSESVEAQVRHCYMPGRLLHLDAGNQRSNGRPDVRANHDRNRRRSGKMSCCTRRMQIPVVILLD